MKPYLLIQCCLLAAGLLLAQVSQAQYHYVAGGEYYIDTDPGVGLATPVNADDGTFDNITEVVSKNISGLTTGFHTLNVRVRDNSNHWGPVFTTVLKVDDAVTARPVNITQGEVFWDTDPGQGNGAAMIAFDGNFNDALEKVMSSSFLPPLTTGLHTLNVRVKGHDATWSDVFTTVVRVDPALSARDIRITAGEAFFDTDPGEGAGTPLIAFDGNFNNALETVMAGTFLPPTIQGLHTLNIRVRGTDGAWSSVFTMVTRVDPAQTARTIKITSGEIFFDTDPGEGAAIPMIAFDGNFDNALEIVSSSNAGSLLSMGVHTMNIRVKGNDGAWSPLFTTVISVDTALAIPNVHIVAGECWWDENIAGAIPLISFDGSFNDAMETVMNNAALIPPSEGFHKINIHVRGLDGNWSNTFSTVVSVEQAIVASSFYITMGEFWWDNDTNNTTQLISFDGTFNDAFETVINNGTVYPPSSGFHKLNIRVKGFDGNYSNTFSSILSVEQPITATTFQITMGELWWDNDTNNTIALISFDGSFNDALETLITNGAINAPTGGFHKLNVHAKGFDGSFGNTFSTIISVEQPITVRDVKIISAQYWWDSDSLSAQIMFAFDGSFNSALEQISASANSGLTGSGFHLLNVRAKSYDNNWSNTMKSMVFVDPCISSPVVAVTPSSPQQICTGSSILLSAVPNNLVSYTWIRGVVTVGSGPTYSASEPGFYKVIGYDANGCPGQSAYVQVDTVSASSVTITPLGSTTFCDGSYLTLVASGGFSQYLWSNGATTQSINVAVSGNYTVTGTSGAGCSATSQPLTVTVHPNPAIPTINVNGATTFCIGGSVQLTSSAANSYLWNDGGSTTQSINAVTSGAYYVTVSNIYGCQATNTVPVIVDVHNPTISVYPAGPLTVCNYNQASLAVYATGTSLSFQWMESGNDISGATNASFNTTVPGNYSCRVTDGIGCTATSNTVAVSFVAPPVVSITPSGSTSICSTGSVDLTASPSGLSYYWSNGATTQTITASLQGDYNVIATDANGCFGTATPVTVTVSSPVNGFVADSIERFLPDNGTVQFTSNTNGTISAYNWKFGDGGTSTLQHPSHTYTSSSAPGFYAVKLAVTNDAGCTDSITANNMIRVWDEFPHYGTTFYSYSTADVTNASFISSLYGCTVQPNGQVYITSDGGDTWDYLGLPCTCHLTGVSYVGSQGNSAIWVAGEDGFTAVNYTGTPGGWITYTIPCGCSISNIYFSSPNNGYAVGTNGQVWFWNGTYWGNISPGISNNFYAVNYWGGYLWAVGYGGVIWQYQPGFGWVNIVSGTIYNLYSISFGCTCVGGGYNGGGGGYGGVGLGVGAGGTIIISNDGGTTWHNSNSGTTYDLTGAYVIDSLHMICVGQHGIILTTADCGLTWVPWSIGNTEDLTSITANGCVAYITGNNGGVYTFPINFNAAPPAFTLSNDTICAGSFATLSIVNPKIGSQYIWSNGSAGSTLVTNVPGNYSVTEYSLCDTISSAIQTIYQGIATASIDVSGSTNLCGNETVTLTASSGVSYLWSNGSIADFIVVNDAGSYSVTVTDISGCSAVADPVIITSVSPLNSIAADSLERFLPGNGTVHFTSNTNGTIVSYLWDFGDGNTSDQANPAHTYLAANAPGFYTVSLTVTNDEGCTDVITITNMIRVWNKFACTGTAFASYSSVDVYSASFISPLYGCVVQPNGQVYQTIDGGTTWLSLGLPCTCQLNGVSYVGTQGNSAIWIAGAGGFTAVNYSGLPGGWTTYLIPCGCDIQQIYFSNPNSGYAVGTNGQVWYWNGVLWSNISPGVTNTFYGVNYWNGYLWVVGYNGIICYYQPGSGWIAVNSGVIYNLYAIAFGCTCPGGGFTGGGYGGVGCSVGAYGSISISNNAGASWHPCNSGTTYDLTGVIVIDSLHMICVGHHGIILTTSDCGLTWVHWSIGNTDDLLSITANGCLAYITGRSGRVYTFPVNFDPVLPDFTVSNDTVCLTSPSTLSVVHPKVGSEYVWSNGSTGNSIIVTEGGDYTVTEIAYCDTLVSSIHTIIGGVATPTIEASGSTNLCGTGTVMLTSSEAAVYLWNTGETTQSIVVNNGGNYSVIVTDGAGCSATSEVIIVTSVDPLSGITADSLERFLPGSGTVQFNSATNGTIATYFWDFGDGTTSDQPNPSHTYSLANAPNFYTVTLKVTSEDGCTDSITVNNMIRVWNIFNHSSTTFATYSTIDVVRASFISPLQGCIVQPNGQVYQTSDGGSTWLSLGLPCTCHLNGVSYTGIQGNSAIWIAGEGGFTAVNYTGTVGGWVTYMIPCGCDIQQIYFSNPNSGYAVGTNGQVWYWNGVLWSNISPVVTNTFYGVNYWNGYLWAVGYNGIICRYQPGTGWIAVNSGVIYNLYAIAFGCTCPGGGFTGGGYGGVGCSVGAYGSISISNNAGASWHPCNSGTTYDLTGVIVIDSLHMICVGHHGIILTTSDCGLTWVHWSIGNTDDLLHITANGCLAYITGRSGRVYTFPVNFDAIPPSFTASADTVCDGESVTLSVTNPKVGSEYVWSNGSTGISISVDVSGSYSLSEITYCDTIASVQNTDISVLPVIAYYQDADGDMYGNAAVSVQSCTPVLGYVTDSTDCNDMDADINPGMVEVINGIDDNCDGQVDEPSCFIPTGLVHAEITSSSELVSWNAVPGATKYKIQYGLAHPNTTWFPKSVTAPGTSILIKGLTPSTKYKWKVRTICGTSKTVFSPTDMFTTLPLKSAAPVNATSDNTVFEVYPNPSNGHFVVELALASPLSESATIQITNLIGQIVYEEVVSVSDGILHQEMQLAAYQKGVFLLYIVVDDQTFTKKLVLAE